MIAFEAFFLTSVEKKPEKMERTPTVSTSKGGKKAAPFNYLFPFTPVNLTSGQTNLKARGSRLFTPIHNSINTPDLSPIKPSQNNQTIFRMPPEKVDKAAADSTVNSESPPASAINKSYLNHNISVEMFLMSRRFHRYLVLFDKYEMDFDDFISLNENDLIRLGVENFHDRERMLRAMKEFLA